MRRSWFACVWLIMLLTACSPNKQYIHVGPNWAALDAMQPSSRTFDVNFESQESAVLGDSISFKVKSAQSGQLWILQVDPNDKVTLLYPNRGDSNNAIPAKRWLEIPKPDSSWSIEAIPPTGQSVLAAIVTLPGTDLADVFDGQNNDMNKALRIVANSPGWGLAKRIIAIEKLD